MLPLQDPVILAGSISWRLDKVHLPDSEGLALGQKIHRDPATSSTILLALTTVPERGDGMRFQEAGFAAYLVKPVRPSLLFDAIATAWSGKGNHALITRHTLQSAGSDLVPLLTRVLVAEDNHVNQKVARAMLQRLGCQVDVAGNGRDAVEMSRAVPYDAIFMDCVMPEPDGYETARQIRKDDPLIPIIAMTANAMPGDREHCIAAGMSDYVAKPIRFGQLVDILSRLPSSGSPSA